MTTQDNFRVAITGVGAVTPIGIGKDGLWAGVKRGQSAVRRISRFDPSEFRSQIAAQVDDFDPASIPADPKKVRRFDRFSQFALAAAMQAVQDAGLDPSDSNFPYGKDEIGVYIGTALGGVSFGEEQHTNYVKGGARAVNPLLALSVFGGAASCNIAMEYGFHGPTIANSNSCASGAMAIGEAYRVIKRGEVKAMVAGGVEAPLAPLAYGAFALIRAMSTSNETPELASRPFDRNRDGFVMAEGAAMLMLEEYESAVQRGATIYAELVGYGTSNDAFHMAQPLPDGTQAARSIRLSLKEAGLQPHQIDYINAHASSTPLNDKTETLAIKQVFGEQAYNIPVSGTKALHGHALGATGSWEAAIVSQIFQHNWLPPTVNLSEPDPDCDLDYIPGTGREATPEHILSNSFGFGGINASLIFKRAR